VTIVCQKEGWGTDDLVRFTELEMLYKNRHSILGVVAVIRPRCSPFRLPWTICSWEQLKRYQCVFFSHL